MDSTDPNAITHVMTPSARDLGGGFMVGRVLPSRSLRSVGPFLFFDYFGPTRFAPGDGMAVRPHPHIHLATVTYLFEGEIVHRDSLGYTQPIHPGDINWMTAGKGIVHSERTSPELRATGSAIHGVQLWLGLPRAHEDTAPEFHHHPSSTLPVVERDGARIRVLAGEAYGARSPVRTFSPLCYADAALEAGASLRLPDGYEQRALFMVSGSLSAGEQELAAPSLVVFAPGADVALRAEGAVRALVLCGAPLDGTRYMEWNFVSSDKARIEQAKRDWKEGRFPKVPGDETEFIPLPEH